MTISIGTINNEKEGIVNIAETIYNTSHKSLPNETSIKHKKQVLQIIGEPTFGYDDFYALKRTGFEITKLEVHKLSELESHIDRMRNENKFIPYWHCSTHSNQKEIWFNGFYITPEWLIDRLNYHEINILFLDTCESVYVADMLVGVCKHIVTTIEPIPTNIAKLATYYFWKNIFNDKNVQDSYEELLKQLPIFAHHFYLRTDNE